MKAKIRPIWRLFTLQSFEQVAQILGLPFLTVKVMYILILTKNGLGYILGYILGDYCADESGHPVRASVQAITSFSFRSRISMLALVPLNVFFLIKIQGFPSA
jgi:predicted ATP-dependent Lon-type protease